MVSSAALRNSGHSRCSADLSKIKLLEWCEFRCGKGVNTTARKVCFPGDKWTRAHMPSSSEV
jgi:hypothetical protein